MSDQRLVNMALKRGFITPQQLEEARRESQVLADRGIERNVSFILMDLGYLSDQQMSEIRNSTSSTNVRSLEINGHVIEGRIGSGGMGDVFRARSKSGDNVAIKLMPAKFAQDEEYLMRFHREVNVMTSLEHPHITGFRDAGEVDDRLFLIMELVEGPNLKEYIVKNGALSEDDVLTLLEQMVSALTFAQDSCGIIHRDVKPANIILGHAREGHDEPFCAKLCDFGLAKMSSAVAQDEEAHLTHSGMAVGTPHYMSPEVATGERYIDQRTDIYSLAATAYHAITGKTMYSGRNSGIIMYQQATSQATLRHWKEHDISSGVKSLLQGMLEKDLFSRIQDWDTVTKKIETLRMKSFSTRIRREESGVDDGPESLGAKAPITKSFPSSVRVSQSDQSTRFTHQTHIQQNRWKMFRVFLSACILFCFILLVSLFLWTGGSHFERQLNPDTFRSGLGEAQESLLAQFNSGIAEPSARLILQAGDYYGPFIFDERCSMLRIQAASSGVRFVDDPELVAELSTEHSNTPLIYFSSGVRHVRLHGIQLSTQASTVIQVASNAEVTLSRIQMHDNAGALMRVQGTVTILGLHAENFASGIHLQAGAQVFMQDSVLSGLGTHFAIQQASARVVRCRFQQLSTLPVDSFISAHGGSLSMDTLVIEAAHSEIAVSLDSMNSVTFKNVLIDAGSIGIRSHQSQITEVIGLSVQARDVGMHWSGPWSVSWKWSGQRIQARQPLQGESIRMLPFEESGADEEVFELVPRL